MKLPALLASDLHLTANPDHEYRWSLFPWLANECACEKVKTLLILGDLTDAKDYHPAALPNRIVREFVKLREEVMRRTELEFEIYILMGNHDYLKGGAAFFEFLNAVPGLHFIAKPTESDFEGKLSLFLPHTKNPAQDWAKMDFSHYQYLFMHQTIKGAVASNGEEMDGEALPDLGSAGKIYSGDIHVPQVIGPIEYVGSPYHVHFGDDFKPRCVLLDRRGNPCDLHMKSPRRVSVKVESLADLRRLKLERGDQVKLTICVDEAQKGEWPYLRRRALELLEGVDVQSTKLEVRRPEGFLRTVDRVAASPEDALVRFVESEELPGSLLETAFEVMQ